MRLPRCRFTTRFLMVAIALTAIFTYYVVIPSWNYYRLPYKTRLIFWKLNTSASLPSGTMALEDHLISVKLATQWPNGSGIPIYVDPVGLQEVECTLQCPVNVPVTRQPIGKTLAQVLDQLGMRYSVNNGMLTISSKESADQPFDQADPFRPTAL